MCAESSSVDAVRRLGFKLILRMVIVGLMASFSDGVAFGQTFVKPGDSGSIELPIENVLPTDGPAEGVEIFASVEPAAFAPHVTVSGVGSVLGPLNIAAQQTQTFVIQYAVGPNAPEGSFDVVIHADMITVGVVPDITDVSQVSRVSFNIADPLFLVGGQKLIFSESAIQNAENQGGRGFYHRAGKGQKSGSGTYYRGLQA